MAWAAQSEQVQKDSLTSLVLEALIEAAEHVCPCLQHQILQGAAQVINTSTSCWETQSPWHQMVVCMVNTNVNGILTYT